MPLTGCHKEWRHAILIRLVHLDSWHRQQRLHDLEVPRTRRYIEWRDAPLLGRLVDKSTGGKQLMHHIDEPVLRCDVQWSGANLDKVEKVERASEIERERPLLV
jgi:hypothetical protein